MKPEEILHDRATRGEALTEAEEKQLASWYAELDRDESMVLFGKATPPETFDLEVEQFGNLQQQIDDLLNQLTEKTKHLQSVMEQNKLLRKEIDVLRVRVAQEVKIAAA